MSIASEPAEGALIIALLISKGFDYKKVAQSLIQGNGPIENESELFNFDYTDYYNKEMGNKIERRFILFHHLISQGELSKIKLATNQIEKMHLNDGNRMINIDPGILTANRFVLATGKDAPHRIYLGSGIFADLTLVFQSGEFLKHPWTYPEYADYRTVDFLFKSRKYYLSKLKTQK